MTVKHRIPCFDGEILVREVGDEQAAVYQVTIQSAKNLLGSGNVLGAFPTMEQAVRMAERFCGFYALARETGYYLRSDSFVKPDEEDIPVMLVLDGSVSEMSLKAMIR